MIRKNICNAAAVSALLALACPLGAAESKPAGSVAGTGEATTVPVAADLRLESEQQKTLYALGLVLSQSLGRLNLQEPELAYLVEGLQDGVLQRPAQVSLDEYGPKVQTLAEERMATAAQREQENATQYLAKRAAEPGAVRTDSGVVILSQQEGTGPNPAKTDTVRVNYEGTLPDGSVFDSSIQRGAPVSFPLDGVIPCWTEAVQKMKVGGKMKVVCPPELAYGAEGRPGIPPNSPLIFDIHLLGIGDTATAVPGKGPGEHEPLLQQVASLR